MMHDWIDTAGAGSGSWARRWGVTLAVAAVASFLVSCAAAPVGPVATAPVAVSPEQATPTPSETAKPVEAKTSFETFVASFDISAEKYTTPQAVTAAFVDHYGQWLNSGLTGEDADLTLLNAEPNQAANSIQSKYDGPITDRMFTDSESGQDLQKNIESDTRKSAILSYYISMNRDDKVKFAMKMELISNKLVSSDNANFANATAFSTHAVIKMSDNGNENIGPYRKSEGQAGQTDITRFEELSFKLDPSSHTWKVDRDISFADDVVKSK